MHAKNYGLLLHSDFLPYSIFILHVYIYISFIFIYLHVMKWVLQVVFQPDFIYCILINNNKSLYLLISAERREQGEHISTSVYPEGAPYIVVKRHLA